MLFLLLVVCTTALRGRDIIIILDASNYVAMDIIHEEHAVMSIVKNYTHKEDMISLYVSRGTTIESVIINTKDQLAIINNACKALHELDGVGVGFHEMFSKVSNAFENLSRGHQIAMRDPNIIFVSNGVSPSLIRNDAALALLQTMHHHIGCVTSVMIATGDNPVTKANLFQIAKAGDGKVYATKRGSGPYEIIDIVFGRGERVVRSHRVVAPEWLPDVL